MNTQLGEIDLISLLTNSAVYYETMRLAAIIKRSREKDSDCLYEPLSWEPTAPLVN